MKIERELLLRVIPIRSTAAEIFLCLSSPGYTWKNVKKVTIQHDIQDIKL